MTSVDVVVIGAGVMGAAAARALAMAGRDVVVFEQFHIGHANGSSHGSARIFRTSYRDPHYVRMAREALPLWRALETESGKELLVTTGAYNTGENLDDLQASMEAGGVELERTEWMGEPALYEPGASVISAEKAWPALVDSARSHGARLVEGVAVESVKRKGNAVAIGAGGETIEARTAVVTAGAWANNVLSETGIELPLRPTRETVAHFSTSDPVPQPIHIEWSSPTIYGLPTPDGLVKAAEHIAGPTADPNAPGEPDEESVARVHDWLRRRLPDAQLVSSETCLYSNTPDESFLLECHGPIVVGSPCSGHGFKFAPLIGARLARLVQERP